MSWISIGLSGLRVSQRAQEIIGQNISNAGTAGYHRQVPQLAVRAIGQNTIGNGVEITNIRRLRSSMLESMVAANAAEAGSLASRIEYLRPLESLFQPGEGSIHDLLENLFNSLHRLAADPADATRRRVVVRDASVLSREFNRLAGEMSRMDGFLGQQISQHVAEVNQITRRIADLNSQISQATLRGLEANDLRDQRDQQLGRLAELVDLRIIDQDHGMVNLVVASTPVVIADRALALDYSVGPANEGIITPAGSSTPLMVKGGRLHGLLQAKNTDLPTYRSRLDALANGLAAQLDGIHATGLARSGAITFAAGTRSVNDPAAPIDTQILTFPPQAGILTITLLNLTAEVRRNVAVAIDPSRSLADIAADINTISGLQASVTPQNTLQMASEPGFAFDFAGRLPTFPENSSITGTSTVRLGGIYTGAGNDTYTFISQGSGSVGVTPGLTLEVRDGANQVIGVLDIGDGYTPDTLTDAVNGIRLQMSAGTINAGDSFTVNVIRNADTAGILTTLGIGTLFTSSGAAGLKVNPRLAADPDLLAASVSGQPGDSVNVQRMASVRDAKTMAGNTQTFREFAAEMVGSLGLQVQDMAERQSASATLGQQLRAQQQSIAGVDPNEELVHLLRFQRAFQMSAEFIAVVNRSFDSLFRIIQ